MDLIKSDLSSIHPSPSSNPDFQKRPPSSELERVLFLRDTESAAGQENECAVEISYADYRRQISQSRDQFSSVVNTYNRVNFHQPSEARE